MAENLPAFTPAQESLFLTLGGRALDSRLPRPFLGDIMADEIVKDTGYDITSFPTLGSKHLDPRTKTFDIAVRAKRLDEVVRRFIARHPDAVVLDLGAGLDTRMLRVDPPPKVTWFDIDFPEVIDFRQRVLPDSANTRTHAVGADVTDPRWLSDVPDDRPVVAVADGLLGFLSPRGFVSLLNRLIDRFESGELAFNAYTTYAVWALKHSGGFAAIAGDVANPGFNDPRAPERWAPGLTLTEEIFLTRAPEVAQLPLIKRFASRLAAPSATLSRMIGTTIFRYRFQDRC